MNIMNKKLQNNQRKWIQIGRLENEMKHLKARYKRFKEYSQTMPSEDIEISLKVASQELKRYKALRKKLIRQALMSHDEVIIDLEDYDYDDCNNEIENPTAEDFERFHQQILAYLRKENPDYQPRSFEEYCEELKKSFGE